ncbi:hypothetical protein ACTNDP_01530 [Paenibacillus barengoltzii]|uniref:hypothetical protein n=1 Tax=Paenibacillus barengoltzii TaxID=343517 RepID=UPI003F88BD22
MSYLKVDFYRLITDKKVILVVLVMLAMAIIDPISVTRHFDQYPGSVKTIGLNPFQFWMLMNSVSWGNNLYHQIFWIMSVLLTGLIYHEDKNTSMYTYQIIRKSRIQYIVSKFVSTGVLSFAILFAALEINVVMTYTLFPDTTQMTEYYQHLIPQEGSFVYQAFLSNPMKEVQIYTFLNALAVTIFVIFSLCLSMLFHFKNRYVALLVPVIILYGITYVFDSFPPLFAYNIRMILQPMAVSAMTHMIEWENVFFVFGGWMVLNLVMISIILVKSRDRYE